MLICKSKVLTPSFRMTGVSATANILSALAYFSTPPETLLPPFFSRPLFAVLREKNTHQCSQKTPTARLGWKVLAPSALLH